MPCGIVITFLLSLLPVSLGIWAIHILFQEDQIFEKAGDWITERVGEYWSKPLINCSVCMSSVWGTIGFFSLDFFFGVHHEIKLLIPFIFCLCGLNVIISKLTSKERIILDDE